MQKNSDTALEELKEHYEKKYGEGNVRIRDGKKPTKTGLHDL